MSTFQSTSSELSEFIQKTENYLDNVVEHGDDQALFIASYLQGHFAVAAGQSQVQNMTEIAQLAELMQLSLSQAFSNNELTTQDQTEVEQLWKQLLTN
ncbi:YfcL family protein [Paraglaciecola aestuariivivens]